jgi:hypothetical protein
MILLQVSEGIRVTGSEKQLLDDKLHAIMAEEVRDTAYSNWGRLEDLKVVYRNMKR